MARDLHDTVIQRLFAVGLSLQSALTKSLPDDVSVQINEALDDLDDTVRRIRTTIFEITQGPTANRHSLRNQVLRTIDELPSAAGLHVDAGNSALVRVAAAVGTAKLLPALEPLVAELLRSPDWAARHAGVTDVRVESGSYAATAPPTTRWPSSGVYCATAASAALAQPAAVAERYSLVPASADGIGKRYMGREISAVMGWQGAAWLEREERDREERTDLLLAALALKPGMVVADIGAGTGYLSRRMSPAAKTLGTLVA
jgi:hypothetical protein